MSYSNGLLSDQSYQTANKYVQRGLPGIGFKLTDMGDYDMQNKKLVNVDEGENNQDVVNKHQLDVGLQTKPNKTDVLLLDGTTHMTGDLDLRGNKIILPGEIQMDRKLITNLDTDENQDLSAVNMITLKNKVQPKADKDYVDFEITKQNALINNTFVKKTGDQMNGNLILPHDSYPVEGNTNKAISYETQREIFLSRRESFPMQADINMNNNFIQNIATPTSSHQVTNKGYCDYNFLNKQKGGVIMGPLSMKRNDLIEIPDTPKFGHSAVNKNYVDGEITKIDTTQFIKKDGSVPMAADLDMNGNKIKNVGTPYTHENDAAVNVGFFNTKLNASNSNVFTRITNNYKQYVNEELLKSHLVSSHIENAFKYLSDQDESSSERNIIVHGIQDFNGSPHKNKKAYDIDLIYTSGTQNYDSKIGINLYPLPVGKFTIIMEYYFPEDINISLLAEASTAIINNQTITNFPSYKKQLVQINQQTKDTPDYLFFTIRGSGTTATNPEGYLVFYGVKEWVDTVPSEIYDHAFETGMFEYDNGNMKMYNDIDMNNHKFRNFYNLESSVMKNYTYINIFQENFYDLTEPNNFVLSKSASGVTINKISPNLRFVVNFNLNEYNSNTGFDLTNGARIPMIPFYSFTFFMSFYHNSSKSSRFAFSNINRSLSIYFTIVGNEMNIFGKSPPEKLTFPVRFANTKVFIWICCNSSNGSTEYKMAISNYSTHLKFVKIEPPRKFATFYVRCPGRVTKIGLINRFYDVGSVEHYHIMLAEKNNGSYLDNF